MARKCSVERAEMKVGGFATAKKNITIQYRGQDKSEDTILANIKEELSNRGINDADIDIIDIYIKPEEQKVFYVVNKNIEGSIAF
ncbi:MAG: DUF6465 family protein [Agathobacter sp.]|nr:DUF6465 family protein [Agathobacter sp.]